MNAARRLITTALGARRLVLGATPREGGDLGCVHGSRTVVGAWRVEGSMRCVQGLVLAVSAALGVLICAAVFASAPALADGACPNEAVRVEEGATYLPDCRAYERITPAYQEGDQLYGYAISESGEQVVLNGKSDLAGNPGSGYALNEGEVYLDERTPAGWQLRPLNAPSSQFAGEDILAAEPTGGRSLWLQHTLAQSTSDIDLYLRAPSGLFSPIGPVIPSIASEPEPSNNWDVQDGGTMVQGATPNYSHIVLKNNVHEDHWPFDASTQPETLYEYEGDAPPSSHPILVAVNGEKGSTDMIDPNCATRLGSLYGSTRNAISVSGETIIFSLEDGDVCENLYVRVDGGRLSPGPASTVEISESECTIACGGASGKDFEGASENDERVFFTSTQKLTNGAIDGTASGNAVGTSSEGCEVTTTGEGGCNLYEYDFASPPHERLRLIAGGEVLGVAGVAEDGSRVYFVSRLALADSGENEYGKVAQSAKPNLYVYSTTTASTRFIAPLGEDQQDVWEREARRRNAVVAGHEGQFLLFDSSTSDLTPDDPGSHRQLFEYDAETAELVRVSKGEAGYNGDGNEVKHGVEEEWELVPSGEGQDRAAPELNISNNGKIVVFETREQLSPRAISAVAGCQSVYEFHTRGSLSEGQVYLLSDGHDNTTLTSSSACGPRLMGMSASGANVLITSADSLVPREPSAVGEQLNIYDVRELGGFTPTPVSGSCQGAACPGMFSTGPLSVPPSSATLSGPDNLPPPSPVPSVVKAKSATPKKQSGRCPKGKRRSHGKCVEQKGTPMKSKRASQERRTK
jgi:hypothetical protein